MSADASTIPIKTENEDSSAKAGIAKEAMAGQSEAAATLQADSANGSTTATTQPEGSESQTSANSGTANNAAKTAGAASAAGSTTLADVKKSTEAHVPKKPVARATKKKMVIQEDDSDEDGDAMDVDYTPSKAAATPSTPSTSAAVKKESPVKDTKSEKSKPKAKESAKKRKRDSSDSEDDESDDESEEDNKKKKKPTPKKTAAKKSKKNDSDDDSEDEKPKKAPRKKATPKKSAAAKDDDNTATPSAKRAKTAETGAEGDVLKWWEGDTVVGAKRGDVRWQTLEHNGVMFWPAYTPHGIKMKYDGKDVSLTPVQEEAASFFAKYLETDHVKKPQFCKNFFKDFLKLLNPKNSKEKHKIEKFELCDFSPIAIHLKKETEKRKSRSKEEKDIEKKEKAAAKEKYGWAMVNGHKEPISNFMVEMPGLFLGRGDHPKTGKIKKRIMPEDITLNLSEEAPHPPCPIKGHDWGNIIHDQTVAWIATWTENITDGRKYVLFAPSSSIRGKSDREKFETARRLRKEIDHIRSSYEGDLESEDTAKRQRATAMWVIDRLALRVGNEKGEDEADTVGCCSLRVEHVKLHAPDQLEFDFLGKDSMRYHNTVTVPTRIFACFKKFSEGKKEDDEIFDRLTTTTLNKHLQAFMPGLTAKVFRTFNASYTLEKELAKESISKLKAMTVDERVLVFNRANREVAILCNHQRTVSKNHEAAMGKLENQINELKEEKRALKQHLKDVKSGKVKKEVKKETKVKKEESDDESDESEEEKKKTPAKKRKRADEDEKLTKEELKAEIKKEIKKEDGEKPVKEKKPMPDDPAKIEKRIKDLDARIAKFEVKKQERDDLKQVALGTSKINYIDPRITIAWCKKVDVPITKVFSRTLRDKFPWAIAEVDDNPGYKF